MLRIYVRTGMQKIGLESFPISVDAKIIGRVKLKLIKDYWVKSFILFGYSDGVC